MDRYISGMALTMCLVASSVGEAQHITITRSGSQPSREGPALNFTGTVRVELLFAANEAPHMSAGSVTFEAGAHSAWHTHPLGQILIVTSGTGRVQRWGEDAKEIRTGDTVWIPPNTKHWHGAAPGSAMTHIAIQSALDGKNVEWMEKVSDEQYRMAAVVKTDGVDEIASVSPALDRFTHLLFYAGWPNVFAAVPEVKDVVDKRAG